MDARTIAHWRLRTQRLTGPPRPAPVDVVGGMLAVQAENPSQSAWAVAARTVDATSDDVAGALDDGRLLRTHVLRPTWHYVRPDDIRWLLELTAPRLRRLVQTQQQERGLTPADVEHSLMVVADALAGGTHLTRPEIADHLTEAGQPSDGTAAVVLDAELSGLVCSGAPRDGVHTYALLEERAPGARRLDHDEAMAELALRYMTGHGPATERDLAYWATQTLTDVRAGLAAVADQLGCVEHDGLTWWFAEPAPPAPPPPPRGHLLQVLDEMHNGYQATRSVIDAEGIVPRGRGASVGMAMVDGQMVGGMRRTVAADRATFEVTPFRPLAEDEVTQLVDAAERYGAFLGREAELTITRG